jgi:hypothetical protein
MEQLQALKELADKVEAKRTKKTPVLWFNENAQTLGWSISFIARAYNGSLDAAHSLHKAVLGDRWIPKMHLRSVDPSVLLYGDLGSDRSYSTTPARAWLLAIIKAKIAELETEGE